MPPLSLPINASIPLPGEKPAVASEQSCYLWVPRDSSLCREGRKTMGRFIFLSSGLLVVFLSLRGTGADQGCLPDWSLYEGHCYKVITIFKTWEDAEKFCRQQSNGKNLATIEWLGKANFVAELVSQTLKNSKYHVWIGMRREDERQQCSSQWTDGSSVSYENVIKYTKCVGLNKNTGYRTWVALPCGNQYPFICQSQLPH